MTCLYHCSDGIGRTGTFMTVYSQIERAKSEGIVDVFQLIRGARMQRFGLQEVKYVLKLVHVNSNPDACIYYTVGLTIYYITGMRMHVLHYWNEDAWITLPE